MALDYYVHPDDLFIDRNAEEWPTKALVYDADGELINRFDKSMSDDQIREAVCFANKVFKIGFERGERAKAYQLRSVLGIEES